MRRLLLQSIIVAIALGFLEGAWTGLGRGGPVNTWMGVLAILAALLVVTFPRFWWVPALAILEETVHLYASGGALDWERIVHHWSAGFLGFNLYPYLTFPLITIAGEGLYRFVKPRTILEPNG